MLYVAIAEPQRQRAIEEICTHGGCEAGAALRGGAAVHPRGDPQALLRGLQAFEHMPDDEACPHCGAPVLKAGDFQCERCELLLIRSSDELQQRDNVSLVRALITAPDRQITTERPINPLMDKTRASGYAHDPERSTLVPIITGGLLAFAEKPLNPFEAYVLSFVDGKTPVSDIARRSPTWPTWSFTPSSSPSASGRSPSWCPRWQSAPAAKPAPEARKSQPAVKAVSTPAPSPAPAPGSRSRSRSGEEPARAPAGRHAGPAAVTASAADGVIQRAVQLERSGKIEEAIEVLEQGISKLPQPAPLYNRLGMILLNQRKDYKRASVLFQKAADLDPDNSAYMMNLYTVLSLTADATNPGKKVKRK